MSRSLGPLAMLLASLSLAASCHLVVPFTDREATTTVGDAPPGAADAAPGDLPPVDGGAVGDLARVDDARGLIGDLDGDGDVDRDDIAIIEAERGKTVAESDCGAPCDLDGDGVISVLDARKLVLLCTRDRCATSEEAPLDGGSGAG